MTRDELLEKISILKNEIYNTIEEIKPSPNRSLLMDAYRKLLVTEAAVFETEEWNETIPGR